MFSGGWTQDEHKLLQTLAKQGLTSDEIAKQLSRKTSSVKAKLGQLERHLRPPSFDNRPPMLSKLDWKQWKQKLDIQRTNAKFEADYSAYSQSYGRVERWKEDSGSSTLKDFLLKLYENKQITQGQKSDLKSTPNLIIKQLAEKECPLAQLRQN